MIHFLLLLAVGVGQDPGAMQDIPCGKDKVHTTDGCRSIMPALAYKIQPPDKPCDKRYEYEAATAPDKPGFVWKSVCAPIMHPLKESEYQEMAQHIRDLERNLKAVVCGNMNYQGTISLDSGKTTTDCATLKPDMRRCKDLGNGLCFVENQPSPER